jgi:hypothetical protein
MQMRNQDHDAFLRLDACVWDGHLRLARLCEAQQDATLKGDELRRTGWPACFRDRSDMRTTGRCQTPAAERTTLGQLVMNPAPSFPPDYAVFTVDLDNVETLLQREPPATADVFTLRLDDGTEALYVPVAMAAHIRAQTLVHDLTTFTCLICTRRLLL